MEAIHHTLLKICSLCIPRKSPFHRSLRCHQSVILGLVKHSPCYGIHEIERHADMEIALLGEKKKHISLEKDNLVCVGLFKGYENYFNYL